MSIGMERLLRHMAWANQKTIEHVKSLPPQYAFLDVNDYLCMLAWQLIKE